MPSPLLTVPWEECVLPPRRDRALESFVKRETGVASPTTPYLAACPWLVRAMVQLSFNHGLLVRLRLELAELISLVVSQEHSCRFCYAVSRAVLRIHGMSEARVEALEGRLSRSEFTASDNAALAFARRMSRSAPLVGSEDRRRLIEAGFSPEEIREIAYVVSYTAFANRVATIPAIPPYGVEAMPDRWFIRLMRPLIAKILAAHTGHGVLMPRMDSVEGPHAVVIQAFAGSPIARALTQALAEAWGSPILTRRCKALLFGVVAQALDCRLSAAAIEPLFASEGLAPAEIAQTLSHLDAPMLTPVERMLLGFARETVWYQPGPIQRRARALRGQLSDEQFTEAVGVLALANALCRLAAAVGEEP
jgi:AhpD family alkylhydroperoxidase